MRVREIMSKHVETCTPQTDLQHVAQMMMDYDCGAIPIVESQDSQRLIGIITDRDIALRAVAAGQDPTALHAEDCMTSDIVCVTPDTDLEECIRKMEARQIRRIPVVDDSGKCCGIVAQADIAEKADRSKTAELVKEVSESPEEHSAHMYH